MTNKEFLFSLDSVDVARALLFLPCNEICKCQCEPSSIECAQRCATGECEENIAEWLESKYQEGKVLW